MGQSLDVLERTRPAPSQPVAVGGCLGWLHLPPAGAAADTAVLLCPGLRTDGVTGHRSFRRLAAALAAAGYPALRFDYPGTANSCDSDGGDLLSAWQASIHEAADWLKQHTAAGRLVLCGLRFGATLAATAATERADVAGLMLLAPVLRGRSYMRQLAIEAGLPNAAPAPDGGIVLHELTLPPATVTRIEQLDLSLLPLPSTCRVAVYARDDTPILKACAAAWAAGGTSVATHGFAGLEAFLRPSYLSHEQAADATGLVGWLRAAVPALPLPAHLAQPPGPAEIRPPGCVETPLRFGPGGSLFGILCRPSAAVEADLAVLITNASGDPHYGFARVGVDVARRFAAAGYASLRMDFAGLGDSTAPGDAESHVFETERQGDIEAGIDALAALGFRRFAVEGLCSGAYHAFKAALDDARIGVLLLVNIYIFEWHVGDDIELMTHALQSPFHFIGKLWNAEIWTMLLKGQLKVGSRIAVQGVWVANKVRALAARLGRAAGRPAPLTFAQRSMQKIAPRTRTLILLAPDDTSVQIVAQGFGPGSPPPNTTVRIVPGFDHSLTTNAQRQTAAEQMIAFLDEDR